ncbi:acetate/propionate family kinase [Ruegeria sp. 2012CJ41-6]|uniref:Acetate kinase n=1 Tax=Ruegeria spongiae TaxID=2942209 RepID=A0ABT0Q7G0_9RHOB|nr:acetate/propionate family kinase [Ruegeria spongiae]MCL6285768.1 acetate/propionate family kinase [Ruegeria spongiae]
MDHGMTGAGGATAEFILSLNAGSSSLKFSLYEAGDEPREIAVGQVESLGPNARFKARIGLEQVEDDLGSANHHVALRAILEKCETVLQGRPPACIGHRIAHGGVDYEAPQLLTPEVMEKLALLEPLAPLHQPHNLAAVRASIEAFPDALQIGCFDTAFHRNHPWVNDTFGLPLKYYDRGVRRYGFHGLSYDYITGTLARIDPELASGRVVIAHLGNGASMCGVLNGRSIASTMGFSALDGLPMGTRCGQLDPGVVLYLMDQEGLSASELTKLLYNESGLKGLSGATNDMRALEASQQLEAEMAIEYYTFRARRELGALAASLHGIDGVVFCGGIGENSAAIRARICNGMDWMGITLDARANTDNEMSIGIGRTKVLVIPTDEERIIARAASRALNERAMAKD